MSDQISSEITYTSYLRHSAVARSSSHGSHTRPQGLCGEQRIMTRMRFSRSFFSMSSKSMRHTPSASRVSGLWTMR